MQSEMPASIALLAGVLRSRGHLARSALASSLKTKTHEMTCHVTGDNCAAPVGEEMSESHGLEGIALRNIFGAGLDLALGLVLDRGDLLHEGTGGEEVAVGPEREVRAIAVLCKRIR